MKRVDFPLHVHHMHPRYICDHGGRLVLEAKPVGLNEFAISAEDVARQVVQALGSAAEWEAAFLRTVKAYHATIGDNQRLRNALLTLSSAGRELQAALTMAAEALNTTAAETQTQQTPIELVPCQSSSEAETVP